MLNPFTPSTFYPFHRACKETVSIFNPFPPSTFYHFHRSHFPPFLQSLGLQQLTWNRVTQKHQKQMKYNCHMLVLQRHLVLVVLAPYHHNHHYHITFFPTTTPPARQCTGFVHLLNTFFWIVIITTTGISWVELDIPLLSKQLTWNTITSTLSSDGHYHHHWHKLGRTWHSPPL